MILPSLLALAVGAPTEFPVAGFVEDALGPVDGARDVVIRLYDGESAAWTATRSVVFDRGRFSAMVGGAPALDDAVLDAAALSITVQVADGPESAPVPVGWAPLAVRARRADAVAWSGITGVPTGFADGTDDGNVYAAGAGLSLTGTTFSAAPYDAGAGVTLTGRTFAASPYDAGSGLALSGRTFSASNVPWATLTGVPSGFSDGVDNGTAYSAGAGLTLTGTTFALSGGGAGTSVQLGNTVTTCNSGAAGTLRWTGTRLEACDGALWRLLMSGPGAHRYWRAFKTDPAVGGGYHNEIRLYDASGPIPLNGGMFSYSGTIGSNSAALLDGVTSSSGFHTDSSPPGRRSPSTLARRARRRSPSGSSTRREA